MRLTNRKSKRVISGLLATVTILSALIQPAVSFAEEPETAAYETEYPALEKVQSELAEDEIVTARDYEVEVGSGFDIENDFSGMDITEEKVTVTFHEAKNQSGQDFNADQPDTYKAVYFVEQVSDNPSYHITRNIIVKEKADVPQSGDTGLSEGEDQPQESESEEGEVDPDLELPPQECMTASEMEAVIEDMEQAEDIRDDAEQIAEDGGLLFRVCAEDGGFFFAFRNQNLGVLGAFRLQNCLPAIALRFHLLFHGVLDVGGRQNVLQLYAGNFNAPRIGGFVQNGAHFGVNDVAGSEGLIQFQIANDVTQSGSGEGFHSDHGLLHAVGVQLGICNLEIHNGINLHGNVILGDNGLGRIVQNLLFQTYALGDSL